MTIHLRFDGTNFMHSHVSLFVNGKNTGKLCMSPAEAIWFHHIFGTGCVCLSPPGRAKIEFISSGIAPEVTAENLKQAVNPYEPRPIQPTDRE